MIKFNYNELYDIFASVTCARGTWSNVHEVDDRLKTLERKITNELDRYEAAPVSMDAIHERIECILNNFDFEKVQKVMHALGWQWYWSNGPVQIHEMKTLASQLLWDTISSVQSNRQETYSVSTGGFKATAHNINGLEFELEFVLASFWTHTEDSA